ncbi:hypothetical protein [uncultured Microbacterium sp.]|uniref:hypothetical protein n=1 Tax=uncultured Microbacterium sp. TaxID=191216 RepID=UPI0025EA1670|nr:hypothetical protein [uncultured Microbacterium sp.]
MMHTVDRRDLELIFREVVSRCLDERGVLGSGSLPSREDIAGAVRAEFARRELHQVRLAEVIGRSIPTARARMKGIYGCQPGELEMVAAFLGMGIGDLLSLAEHGARFTGGQNAAGAAPPAPLADTWEQPPRSRRRGRAY